MKNFYLILKKVLLFQFTPPKTTRRFIASIFRRIWKLLSYVARTIIRMIFYPFRGVKNLIRTIVFILIIVYIGVTSYTSYLVFSTNSLNDQREHEIIELKEKLRKSVVRIVGGFSEGSGFFVEPDQVMTSFHVIDGEPSPKIIFPDGSFITPIKIIGDRQTDLAVLNTAKKYSNLVVPLPKQLGLTSGETLIAAGYPLGTDIKGPPTVVEGNYLASRQLAKDKVEYIQTDFSLVNGMSGGPLINIYGDLVGINALSIGGQSLFISSIDALLSRDNFTDKDMVKISHDPSKSPEEAVSAYYAFLRSHQLKKGFELLSSLYLNYSTFEEWANRFRDILDVNIISVERYKKTKDIVYVKFETKNWTENEVEYHSYQGTWKTVLENGVYKLERSNIEEISGVESL